MKYTVFLLLVTQTFLYTANSAVGLEALLAASRKTSHQKPHYCAALSYLSHNPSTPFNKQSQIAERVKKVFKAFGIKSTLPGGKVSAKYVINKGPQYRLVLDTQPKPTDGKDDQPKTIRGGGKKMTEFKKAGPARAEKRDIEDIKTDIKDAKTKLLNKQVQHSKTGNIYTVFGITTFVTTQNTMVHYRDIKTGIEWSRAIDDFLSQDTIDGVEINKFVLIKGT